MKFGGQKRFERRVNAVKPMFQKGNKVAVWISRDGQTFDGKVVMASAKYRSLFIDLADGGKVTILGVPRSKGDHK